MRSAHYPFDLVSNQSAEWRAYADGERAVLNLDGLAAAEAAITAWPGYEPTPLISLPKLAADLDLGAIAYKDEGKRFELESFKALGGAYAVLRVLTKAVAPKIGHAIVSAEDLTSGRFAEVARGMTVCCATDGNHGRSVAWGAQRFGCGCVIFIHETVSEGRKAAIERFGAEVRRVAGNYDDSVRAAQVAADTHGWTVVSDTSYPGYTEIPCDVMQGYALMAAEADRQWSEATGQNKPPTHVFIQAGVGGVAAAVISYFWETLGTERPMSVAVEPETAACVVESVRAGQRVTIEGDLETVMAGLACGEVSLAAWAVLEHGLDAALSMPDWTAEDLMRKLAEGISGDRPIVAGESGVTGLAGVIAAAADPMAREALCLGPNARVLVFGTEGATDPEVYERIVGRPATAIGAT
ncbi:MAG: diaminopropionate ammonia-lyase [Pseudomonadota bacterium]